MRSDRSVTVSNDIEFSQSDFEKVSGFAKNEIGLTISEAKTELLYSRIARRMRLVGETDFEAYFRSLEVGGCEEKHFISLLTTNVTSFFREGHHFELLRKIIARKCELTAEKTHFRIWSAGCSSGQEAYSIALVLDKLCSVFPHVDFDILASDVDDSMLRKAKSGQYLKEETQNLDGSRIGELFCQSRLRLGEFEVKPKLKSRVSFRNINLMNIGAEVAGFDFIFCRNVVIYFDRATQDLLWKQFHCRIKDGGVLFLGQAERLSGVAEKHFKKIGITAFEKTKGNL